MTKDFDFDATLTSTKTSLEQNTLAAKARIEFIEELRKFFKDNHLRVVQDVEDETKPEGEETKAEAETEESK